MYLHAASLALIHPQTRVPAFSRARCRSEAAPVGEKPGAGQRFLGRSAAVLSGDAGGGEVENTPSMPEAHVVPHLGLRVLKP